MSLTPALLRFRQDLLFAGVASQGSPLLSPQVAVARWFTLPIVSGIGSNSLTCSAYLGSTRVDLKLKLIPKDPTCEEFIFRVVTQVDQDYNE